MKINLFIIGVILMVFSTTIIETSKIPILFDSMKACLVNSGVNTSNIVIRSDKNYKSLNYQWQLRLPMTFPVAYILVETEEDIQNVVTCGRKYDIRIVAKGGGHSFEKYSFGDSRSVVVDLRKMSEVIVDKSSMTASVGSGALLGNVYWKLWKAGKFFIPSGTCLTIGISGVAMGGGYGLLSRKYGLTTDHIVDMNLITVNGTLLEVNNVKNSDLFWALRGAGGGNFGIVSKFVFKITTAPSKIFYGTFEFQMQNFSAVLTTWLNYFATNPSRTIFSQIVIRKQSNMIFFTDSNGRRGNFEYFRKLLPPAVNTTEDILSFPDFLFTTAAVTLLKEKAKPKSFSDFEHITRGSESPFHLHMKSWFFKSVLGMEEVLPFKSLMEEIPDHVKFVFGSFGGAISDIRIDKTAFVHRGNLIFFANAEYYVNKTNLTTSTPAELWLDKVYDLGKSMFNSTESYQNYADAGMSNYLQRYYASNLPRLVEIKNKYDSANYFNDPQSIPPHI